MHDSIVPSIAAMGLARLNSNELDFNSIPNPREVSMTLESWEGGRRGQRWRRRGGKDFTGCQ